MLGKILYNSLSRIDSQHPEFSGVGWRLLKLLGKGGQGEAWEAEPIVAWGQQLPSNFPKKVVVKIGSSIRREHSKMVAMELEKKHKGLPLVFTVGSTEENVQYMVMELVSGVPLSEIFFDGKRLRLKSECGCVSIPKIDCDVSDLSLLGSSIIRSLQYIHSFKYIFRDISPGNVLVDLNSTPLKFTLIDFGVAESIETTTKDFKGTPEYASPNTLDDSTETGALDDLVSVGFLLAKLLTGKLPWEDVKLVTLDDYNEHAIKRKKMVLRLVNDLKKTCMPNLALFLEKVYHRSEQQPPEVLVNAKDYDHYVNLFVSSIGKFRIGMNANSEMKQRILSKAKREVAESNLEYTKSIKRKNRVVHFIKGPPILLPDN